MGLLSDPEYGSAKWVKILKRIQGPVCFLCYVGAIGWFLMLGNKEFNNETYFSENALLPGLVTKEFNAESSANKFYNEFIQEMEDKYEELGEMPVPWLVGKMSQLHLEVHVHNFTLNYPMGQGQVYKGTNVYGILRAARTASLEALVVSAPFRSLSSHQKGTAAGIALMLAFAQFARPQKYWAKDIIFLVTEYEQLGIQAWLEAYHGLNNEPETFYSSLGSFWQPGMPLLDLSKLTSFMDWGMDTMRCLDPGKLAGRSGSIQAAINLEFDTPKIKYIEVKIEGLNGQLPNLDLVNLVHKLCVKAGIHHSYKHSYSWIRRNKIDEWINGIWTMLGMVNTQFTGVPTGNHGLFHRYGIEAVTLEGRDANDPAGAPPRVHSLPTANFYKLGVALESILRSLNNLLERFHQSYFFYLLAGTNRFISIGQYMPTLCLMCAALLIRALSLWVDVQHEDERTAGPAEKETVDVVDEGHAANLDVDDESPKGDSGDDTENKADNAIPAVAEKDQRMDNAEDVTPAKVGNGDNCTDRTGAEGRLGGDEDNKTTDAEPPPAVVSSHELFEKEFSIIHMGANYLLVHIFGYMLMNMPSIFTQVGATFDLPSELAVYLGLVGASAPLVFLAPLLPRAFCSRPPTRGQMTVTNILALIELATACLVVGMHNFSLGLLVASIYTPLALSVAVVDKADERIFRLFAKRFYCIILHPLCLLSHSMIAYSRVLFPEEGIIDMMSRGNDAAMQAIMFSIVDSMIYGNWLYNVATCVLLPTWILFWQILCVGVEAPAKVNN